MKQSQIAFNQERLQNIKQLFEEKTGVQLVEKKVRYPHRKLIAVALAAILCTSAGTPVLAANVPGFYQFMYMVSPSIAQFLMPVQKSAVSNGIKMEVVSAAIHGNTADIYITMQDLTGDRIDGTTDLYDSYSINRPFASSATCRLIGYDDATKTATFHITIKEWGDHNITGDKITFSAREFLSHKMNYEEITIPLDLSSVTSAVETQKVDSTGGSGRDYPDYERKKTVLTPSEAKAEFPIEGIDVTAIGYIGTKLHVQLAYHNNLKSDNHGTVYLKDGEGNRLDINYSVRFMNQHDRPEDRIDYTEYVFDIPQGDMQQYTLYGDFVSSGMWTAGRWSVTFPLEQAAQ